MSDLFDDGARRMVTDTGYASDTRAVSRARSDGSGWCARTVDSLDEFARYASVAGFDSCAHATDSYEIARKTQFTVQNMMVSV